MTKRIAYKSRTIEASKSEKIELLNRALNFSASSSSNSAAAATSQATQPAPVKQLLHRASTKWPSGHPCWEPPNNFATLIRTRRNHMMRWHRRGLGVRAAESFAIGPDQIRSGRFETNRRGHTVVVRGASSGRSKRSRRRRRRKAAPKECE